MPQLERPLPLLPPGVLRRDPRVRPRLRGQSPDPAIGPAATRRADSPSRYGRAYRLNVMLGGRLAVWFSISVPAVPVEPRRRPANQHRPAPPRYHPNTYPPPAQAFIKRRLESGSPNEKHSYSSNDDSPTSPTQPSLQTPNTPHSPRLLDIGETHMRCRIARAHIAWLGGVLRRWVDQP